MMPFLSKRMPSANDILDRFLLSLDRIVEVTVARNLLAELSNLLLSVVTVV